MTTINQTGNNNQASTGNNSANIKGSNNRINTLLKQGGNKNRIVRLFIIPIILFFIEQIIQHYLIPQLSK